MEYAEMECKIELDNAFMGFNFDSKGYKQKIIVDFLLKYGECDIHNLSQSLNLPAQDLQNIYEGKYYYRDEKANDLAQYFLMFLSRIFSKKSPWYETLSKNNEIV